MKILIRFDDIAENMNWHLMDKCEKLFDKYDFSFFDYTIGDNGWGLGEDENVYIIPIANPKIKKNSKLHGT